MCEGEVNCSCSCKKTTFNENSTPLEAFIKKIGLGPGLLIKVSGDKQLYVVKNISADRKTVFVQDEPHRTRIFNKNIKKIIWAAGKSVQFTESVENLIKQLELLTERDVLLEEKKNTKIKRDAFLYLASKEPKSDFAQCSTCVLWTTKKHNTCAIIGSGTKVTGTMSCGLYLHGEPNEKLEKNEKNIVTSEEVGLVDRKVRCENCKSFDEKESKCLLFEVLNKQEYFDLDTKVDKHGCCNAQTPKE